MGEAVVAIAHVDLEHRREVMVVGDEMFELAMTHPACQIEIRHVTLRERPEQLGAAEPGFRRRSGPAPLVERPTTGDAGLLPLASAL